MLCSSLILFVCWNFETVRLFQDHIMSFRSVEEFKAMVVEESHDGRKVQNYFLGRMERVKTPVTTAILKCVYMQTHKIIIYE